MTSRKKTEAKANEKVFKYLWPPTRFQKRTCRAYVTFFCWNFHSKVLQTVLVCAPDKLVCNLQLFLNKLCFAVLVKCTIAIEVRATPCGGWRWKFSVWNHEIAVWRSHEATIFRANLNCASCWLQLWEFFIFFISFHRVGWIFKNNSKKMKSNENSLLNTIVIWTRRYKVSHTVTSWPIKTQWPDLITRCN